MVKTLHDNAGDGFDPWSRKIPHSVEQLILCTTTTEPMCPQLLKPRAPVPRAGTLPQDTPLQ